MRSKKSGVWMTCASWSGVFPAETPTDRHQLEEGEEGKDTNNVDYSRAVPTHLQSALSARNLNYRLPSFMRFKCGNFRSHKKQIGPFDVTSYFCSGWITGTMNQLSSKEAPLSQI